MRIRSTFALICFIIALLATSCTNKAIDEQLSLAESLMTERPDSALSIMNSIEPDELTGDRQKALYALLMTQARYKNYIDETNDSLINIAVEYFENHDDTRYKMFANYYCSRISQKNDNYTMSLYLLLKAFDYAKELNDDLWIGMIAQGISDDYMSNIMSDFRRDLPGLKDDDYKLYLYSILGFSASTIELFLKESKVENVYNRKARLKNKINQLEQSKRERYLSCLK